MCLYVQACTSTRCCTSACVVRCAVLCCAVLCCAGVCHLVSHFGRRRRESCHLAHEKPCVRIEHLRVVVVHRDRKPEFALRRRDREGCVAVQRDKLVIGTDLCLHHSGNRALGIYRERRTSLHPSPR